MSNPFPELAPFDTANDNPPQVQPRTIEQADSFLAQEMRKERDNQVRATIEASPNPDQVARGTRVAREAGVPPLMVDNRLDEAEKGLNAQKLTGMMERYPAIGKWAATNPRGAATAQDDHQSLGILGGAWDAFKNFDPIMAFARAVDRFDKADPGSMTNSIIAPVYASVAALMGDEQAKAALPDPSAAGKALVSGSIQIPRMATAPSAWAADVMGWDSGYRAARGADKALEGYAKSWLPRSRNWAADQVLQGVANAPNTVASLALATTGSALGLSERGAAILGVMPGSLQQGGQSYITARDQGVDKATATIYGLLDTAAEAGGEYFSAKAFIHGSNVGQGVLTRYIRSQIPDVVGEEGTSIAEATTAWMFLPENRDKTLNDLVASMPETMASTAIQSLVGGGLGNLTIAGVEKALNTATEQRRQKVASEVREKVVAAAQAQKDAEIIQFYGKAAQESKLNQRDPEAYHQLLRAMAEDHGIDNVPVSGEALKSYMQSDSYDHNADVFKDYSSQIEEAAASGGDVMLPVDFAFGTLPKTEAWNAVKDDIRLTAGGMSAREAQTFQEGIEQHIAELNMRMETQDKALRAERTAREKLTDAIAEKLGDSYTAPAARTMAEITAHYLQTRAARQGIELTGDEFNNVDVKQIIPEALAQARKADATDLVINALRKGKDATAQGGKSLIEFLAERGGLNDTGGDLAAMGLDQWHKGKVGQKKVIRNTSADMQQTSMGGISGVGDFGLDTALRAAIDAGYFPELQGGQQIGDEVATMLDAIGQELAGNPRYAEAAKTDPMRAAAEELRHLLSEAGHAPEAMTDAEVRAFVERLDEKSAGGGLEQEARGRISGFDTGKILIELFEKRNLSTFMHEFGHLALENLRADAEMEGAPDQLKADWQAVQDWFAANGHPITDSIPTDAHELWARGVEAYLMEGKAPSPALKRIFETVRAWMVSIYKTIDRLKSPITPEIREVMDRLIATDDEIAAAKERQGLEALFKDAATIGMSNAEFDAYQQQVDNARAEANAKLVDKTLSAIRARETKRYREARAAVREEIAADIDARPVYRALRNLKTQPISAEWVRDEMGEDTLGLLPRRVPPIVRDNGGNPNAIAEMSGYATGREMIEALIGAEMVQRQAKEGGDQRSMREREIETATDAEMNRRHGDPLNDGSIEREALAAVHNDMQGEVIASEIRVLARKTNKRPTPYALAREWAREKVRSGRVVDEASPAAVQRYARSAAKAGRAAEQAMLKQDIEETFRQKQFQMLNNALVSEAKAAMDEVDAAVKRMERIASRQTMKSVDQAYLEQAQALLEAVELKERTQKSIERQGKWAEWAQARQAEGYDVVVPDSFEASIGKTHYTKLSVENLTSLDEAVKQVIHLGRLKQTLLDNQERREWDEIFQEAEQGAGGLKQKPPKDLMEPGRWESIKAGVSAIDAGLLKMETIFDWLDGGNPNGVFNRIAFRPVAEAQGREQDMLGDYYGRVKGLFEAIPAKTLKAWTETATMPFTDRETGRPVRLRRQQLVAVALNTGNAGNLQRLTDGYGWNAEALQSYLASELTAEEWQFVQGVWDTIGALWPEIEAMEKRINGIAPEKVAATPIVTPHGTFDGGYYPAIYDSTRDLTAEEQRGREGDLFETTYTRASTRASATKERSEKVSRPILLDLGVINRHLGEVIHDLTHREAVMQAQRFLTNRRVMAAVDNALGQDIRKQFRPWVKFVANSWAMERAGNEGIGKFFNKLRANATAVGMGFRLTTMITQLAGYSNSIEVVGERWMAPAIARASASPLESWNFVRERSAEVRNRMDTLDRDIRLAISQGAGKTDLGAVKRFMYHGIGYMDRVVVVPTWIAAYNKALSEGMSEEDAGYAGDKAVRQSQGAGSPKDLAAIQRGTGKWGEMLKLFTMFYSYFSAMYQRERTLGRDVMGADTRRARNVPKLMARAWWLLVVPPLLTEVMKAAITGNGGPDDDEWWLEWVSRKMLANALGPIPMVRDAFEPVWNAAAGNKVFGYSMSPLQRVGDAAVAVGTDAHKIANGDETKHATKDVLETVGYATGLVPGQVASAAQFLVDVGMGDADPQGFSEWMEGLTTGKVKK